MNLIRDEIDELEKDVERLLKRFKHSLLSTLEKSLIASNNITFDEERTFGTNQN